MIIEPTSKKLVKERIEGALAEASRERRFWIPSSVSSYLVYAVAEQFFDKIPEDIVKTVEEKHFAIPRDRVERFSHLRGLGNFILYWHSYCGLKTPKVLRSLAQEYYGGAAVIGKKLNEPETSALEVLADDLPEYEPIIKLARWRLVA